VKRGTQVFSFPREETGRAEENRDSTTKNTSRARNPGHKKASRMVPKCIAAVARNTPRILPVPPRKPG